VLKKKDLDLRQRLRQNVYVSKKKSVVRQKRRKRRDYVWRLKLRLNGSDLRKKNDEKRKKPRRND